MQEEEVQVVQKKKDSDKEPHNPDTCHDKKCKKCPKDKEDVPKSDCDHSLSTTTQYKTRTKIVKKVFTKYVTTTTSYYDTVTETCTETETETETITKKYGAPTATQTMSKKKFPWFAQMFAGRTGSARFVPGAAATNTRLAVADKYRDFDAEPTDRYEGNQRIFARALDSPTGFVGSEIRDAQVTPTAISTADTATGLPSKAVPVPPLLDTNDTPSGYHTDTKAAIPSRANARATNGSFATVNGSFVIISENGTTGPSLNPAKSRSSGNVLTVQIAASFVVLLVVYIAFQN